MKIECSFSFDDLNLLGVKSGLIFIRGVSNNNEDCVLAIKKSHFNKMFKLWLKEKEDFCKRYDHFCGVGGFVYCECEYFYKTKLHDHECGVDVDDPEWSDKVYKSAVAYKVINFSEQIDMEHG